MTDPTTTEVEGDIGQKMNRIQEIIAQIEDGEISLDRAKQLRDEGKELLRDVEEQLDLGDASVIERE